MSVQQRGKPGLPQSNLHHFRITSGEQDRAPVLLHDDSNALESARSLEVPWADDVKSSLSLQDREKSHLRDQLTSFIQMLCTNGVYAMVACASDLRQIVPATLHTNTEMTQLSCGFDGSATSWDVPIATIQEIITDQALNTHFPLNLTEGLMAKTCAIRSGLLEDIVIMCETSTVKKQLVSALSLFIMLPNKVTPRVPLISLSPEAGSPEWMPSSAEISDDTARLSTGQSPIGTFAQISPEAANNKRMNMLSPISERTHQDATPSTEKRKKRDKSTRSRKRSKSRSNKETPKTRAPYSDEEEVEDSLVLPIEKRNHRKHRTKTDAPDRRYTPQPSRGRPVIGSPTAQPNGTVYRTPARNGLQSTQKARPMGTRSPSPYLRAQRRDATIPPIPVVYSLGSPTGTWTGPRAAKPPKVEEFRFPGMALNCCNVCNPGDEPLMDRLTLKRVMAPMPGFRYRDLADTQDTVRSSPATSGVGDGRRSPHQGISVPSTHLTASQADASVYESPLEERRFDPPAARFGRQMPATKGVSALVGYKSPVAYKTRDGLASTARSVSPVNVQSLDTIRMPSRSLSPRGLYHPPENDRLIHNGIVMPKRSNNLATRSPAAIREITVASRTPAQTFYVPLSTRLMSTSSKGGLDDRISCISETDIVGRVLPVADDDDTFQPNYILTKSLESNEIAPGILASARANGVPPNAGVPPTRDLQMTWGAEEMTAAQSVPTVRVVAAQPEPSIPLLMRPPVQANTPGISGVAIEPLDTPVDFGVKSTELLQTSREVNLTISGPLEQNASSRGDRSRATGFSAFFDRELSESTWQPHITDNENTMTLLHAKQLDSHPYRSPSPLKEEDETFSISASQVVPRPPPPRDGSNSQLVEGSIWRSDLGHKQMTPLEKLKTANIGFPTPFTMANAERQKSSEANMMTRWSRSKV